MRDYVVRRVLPAPESAMPASEAHVRDLIARWQEQDGIPTAVPASNNGTLTPSEALFRQWEREDEQLSDAEYNAQTELWEQFQRGINAERAASGARLVF